eukprot:3091477-Amphidinium_carterae.1
MEVQGPASSWNVRGLHDLTDIFQWRVVNVIANIPDCKKWRLQVLPLTSKIGGQHRVCMCVPTSKTTRAMAELQALLRVLALGLHSLSGSISGTEQ